MNEKDQMKTELAERSVQSVQSTNSANQMKSPQDQKLLKNAQLYHTKSMRLLNKIIISVIILKKLIMNGVLSRILFTKQSWSKCVFGYYFYVCVGITGSIILSLKLEESRKIFH